MSLPTRERGLKHKAYQVEGLGTKSLPTRERGLKLGDSVIMFLLF